MATDSMIWDPNQQDDDTTTDSTATGTAASERPEVPVKVLVVIEAAMGWIAATHDAIEDWALERPGHGAEDSTFPDSIEELWAAQGALNIASNLLRLYTRENPSSTGYSFARCAEVEPGERPAISWELVRNPLYDVSSQLYRLMREAATSYQERTGDTVRLPEAWEALGQVQMAVSLALSILALYEDRRVRPSPEPEEPEERPQPCTCTACGQSTADMRFHRCPDDAGPEDRRHA